MATMTLITAKTNVRILLRGSGSVSVNWGDGKSNPYTLSANSDCTCTHSYTGTAARTITITGNAVTVIDCSNNELTGLNVAGNISLKQLKCHTNKLTSLANLNTCTNLDIIWCYNNSLTSLNLSGLANLTYLDCYNNKLTSLLNLNVCTKLSVLWCNVNSLASLNLSGLSNLTNLRCSENKLTSLTNLNVCTKLETIWCHNNNLTSLNLSGLANLTYLDCYKNKLTSLLNLNFCTKLSVLWCNVNSLTSLNLSGLANLTNLRCSENQLTSLTNLNVCTKLENIWCYNNSLTGLNVSGLTKLAELRCHSNNLRDLTFIGCAGLKQIYCADNYLTGLNANGFTNLTYLSCYDNHLSSLNVSGCTVLESIYCSNNKLPNLSVSGLSKLTYLNCKNNQLAVDALNNLFTTLPTIPSGISANLYVIGNPGATGSCNTATATNKKWAVDFNSQTYDRDRRAAINAYLRGLSFKETAIQEEIDKERREAQISGNYLITYVDSYRNSNGTDFLMSCDKHRIYPGALLVVDSNLGTMTPTESGLARGSLKVSIADFPSTMPGGNSRDVTADRYGSLEGPVNNAISGLVENFAQLKRPLRAEYTDKVEDAQSLDEISLKMNCSAKFMGVTVGASFDQNKTSYASYYLTDFTQVFYTAAITYDRNDLSTLFGGNVTVEDIKKSFGNKPVVLIRSVKYGRRLYLAEELKGSNQNMLQTFSVQSKYVDFDQSFSKSTSKIEHKYNPVVNGGSTTNAATIFGAYTTPAPKDETPVEACKRKMNDLRTSVTRFKTANENVNFATGNRDAEVNGTVLSYNALRIDGVNPKDAVFWTSGVHKVKKLIPNTGLKVNVFNTMKDHNIMVSGYYTLFNNSGQEQPTQYPLIGKSITEERRVYNKLPMNPEVSVPKNIYRVFLNIRHRDANRQFTNHYILPCANIYAAYLRAGSGGEAVNWFFGGDGDSWYNDIK